MNVLHNTRFLSLLNERILCRLPTTEKRLALTFDDGPHPRHTPRVLELLQRKNVRATFFVVGKRVKRFPELLQRTVELGHEIGNHSYHHWPLPMMPTPMMRRELSVTHELITAAAGITPRFMRPPRGWFDARVLRIARSMGYEPVIGSVHPQDSRRPGASVIIDRVRERIEPGAIIILHDGGWRLGVDRTQTIRAADRLIDELQQSGYRFETMSELLATP